MPNAFALFYFDCEITLEYDTGINQYWAMPVKILLSKKQRQPLVVIEIHLLITNRTHQPLRNAAAIFKENVCNKLHVLLKTDYVFLGLHTKNSFWPFNSPWNLSTTVSVVWNYFLRPVFVGVIGECDRGWTGHPITDRTKNSLLE